MKYFITLFLFIICTISVNAANNIWEFDEKSDIILTTSVYQDGFPYSNATCNLTIFKPPPLENFIKLSVIMDNKGHGIFSTDLTGQLEFNQEIYPLTLYCNDTNGTFAQDDRVGIKIGVKLYDFIIPGAILIAIAFLFIYISFKIDGEENNALKLLMFYLGLVFVLTSLFYALAVVDQIPVNDGLRIIFITLISIFSLIIVLMILLQFVDKIKDIVNRLIGTK